MKDEYKKKVIVWLLTGAVLVMAMVVIGGITRLTHSGLSMVNWKPLTGIIPPLNEEAWANEFDNYKNFPEYKKINYAFTLEDFKSIYWWEFIHRVLGRIIGLVFIVPFIIFLWKKAFDKKWIIRLVILFGLGGLQGFLGWFMVKSGLVENPAVSHFRLAIHLIAAFAIIAYITWLIFDVRGIKRAIHDVSIKNTSFLMMFLIVVQIVYGAFVAGLKAGLILNTYPLMGNVLISDIAFSAWADTGLSSLVNEQVTVQFIHRWLPFLILLPLYLLWKKAQYSDLRKPIQLTAILWLAQSFLGVITLLLRVPVSLGVLHQFGAIFLFLGALYIYYCASGKKTGEI
ncbi:MAG: COX15/CtaA family protein [Cyclobacteriaceae bacterium]|nr:COX15/CtaA family protein [Cyclobacteriaceae bacterium]